jgi:hypothetical protein
MPIRAYLNGQRFDAETTRLMGIAFEMALVMLQRTDGIVNPTRDAVAQKIIELAKAGENDPERLCEAALQALRVKPRVIISDPNPLPPLFSPLVLPDFLNFSQSGERPDRALNPDRSQIGTARFRSTRKHAARRR